MNSSETYEYTRHSSSRQSRQPRRRWADPPRVSRDNDPRTLLDPRAATGAMMEHRGSLDPWTLGIWLRRSPRLRNPRIHGVTSYTLGPRASDDRDREPVDPGHARGYRESFRDRLNTLRSLYTQVVETKIVLATTPDHSRENTIEGGSRSADPLEIELQ